MTRRAAWLQVVTGWLPVWGLFAALIVGAHGSSWHTAIMLGFRMVVSAALLALVVQRLTVRFPWPPRVRPGFVALHVLFAAVYSVSWLLLNSLMESARSGRVVFALGPGIAASLSAGVWLYVMIAGISYASRATQRAAQAEANAVRSQLAALRSQLHPHFLFNALHTVVQLIPIEPKRAAQAAEQLAALLRRSIEDDRDLVSVDEEWVFVEQYLDIERIRFGDRLRVTAEISDELKDVVIPIFSLQTLVENAVRHGAAPKVEATEIVIVGTVTPDSATITLRDNGVGASSAMLASNTGTGLRRLRERLVALYGTEARLEITTSTSTGFTATLVVPRHSKHG